MKNLIYKSAIITFSILLFNSCESFIDLAPLDKVNATDYWKTTTDLKNYMLQFYPRMPLNEAWYAGNADDMIIGGSPDIIMNGERVPSTGGWTGQWTSIRDVNIFFENYQKCGDKFEAYKHYVGEAYFFRAGFYFNLLKRYGDLPWYSEVLQLDSEEELFRPRDPRTMIADNILDRKSVV